MHASTLRRQWAIRFRAGQIRLWARQQLENTQDGALRQAHTVDGYLPERRIGAVGDIDGDGDLDVLTVPKSYLANRDLPLVWYENRNEGREFIAHQIDSIRLRNPQFAFADLDGDGDEDLLAAHYSDIGGQIVWLENTNGPVPFAATGIPIARFGVGTNSMATHDLDGDNDLDVASIFTDASGQSRIQWHKNLDSNGTFVNGSTLPLPATPQDNLLLADVNGDGDVDVISRSRDEGTVHWFENADGIGTFSPSQSIGSSASTPVQSWLATDIDADGNLDLVVALESADGLERYEWSHDNSAFERSEINVNLPEVSILLAANWANSEPITLLAASDDKLIQLENRVVGDVNRDGKFDSSDLVRVFQSADYEDDIQGNSSFDQGDWNLDGDFNSSDFVLAFQIGHYEQPLAAHIAAAVVHDDPFRQKPQGR